MSFGAYGPEWLKCSLCGTKSPGVKQEPGEVARCVDTEWCAKARRAARASVGLFDTPGQPGSRHVPGPAHGKKKKNGV